MQSREDIATRVLQETGAVLLHPYNDGRIIRYNADLKRKKGFLSIFTFLWHNCIRAS